MHENEFNIDEQFAHALLLRQTPQWASLPIKKITSSGTDHALFRLGNEYIIRLPRIEWEPGNIEKSINKEYKWVPQLAKFLKIPISEPIFKGIPDENYPWFWTINKWNEGQNPHLEIKDEYNDLAKDLALFLNDFHKINLPNGPYSRRGVALKKQDLHVKNAIRELKNEIDTQHILSLWDQFANIPPWNKNPVWLHGDFLPGNVLIQNNRLNAVIDFSDVGIGDSACDFIIAWSLLNPLSRKIFKDNLVNIDENTWKRGKGWALSISLIMLPYYKNTNPVLTTLAKRMLANILTCTDQ